MPARTARLSLSGQSGASSGFLVSPGLFASCGPRLGSWLVGQPGTLRGKGGVGVAEVLPASEGPRRFRA